MSPAAGMVSGEGVEIELSRAGLGSRTIAALIDLAGQLVALLVLLLLDTLLRSDSALTAAIVVTELVAVFAGYPVLSEWLWRGRTLGKLAMGLRVVRDDGGPIGLRQALTRGLCGLVLEKPGLLLPVGTAAGMITLSSSRESKRIGDFLAGTFVVNERLGSHRSTLAGLRLFVPAGLEGWAAMLDLTGLDDQLALGARQFVLRANQFTPAARDQLGGMLAGQLLAVVSPPPPYPIPTSAVLLTVLAERRRRTELAGRAPFTPAPPFIQPPPFTPAPPFTQPAPSQAPVPRPPSEWANPG